ncbi:FGGY-family carbohydrate kinase [Niabella ginsengisoli]|uniref:FGGY-family carbohydrate kinase n=1 Tax=Niabella ginsengisoli TaxID=522298 RepID=A0ABS9SN37_9BACT|nr:FGGY-family carbohydrate kinase [Niabella ginsengisoli]MCH5599790.1 FGGY-family carbohydrate kinase [Niabella ginsengisoli]
MSLSYFIGIDIGTQGARVIMMDESGHQLAAKENIFELTISSRQEQDPEMWWRCCYQLLGNLCKEVTSLINLSHVKAIGVTSTSGTIIPVNKNYKPVHPAIMYSDNRSSDEADYCRQAAIRSGTQGYTAFNASSGLPKMLWFIKNYPQKIDRIGRFIHAADFITGTLSGNFDTTDYTNTLKSGYDLHQMKWPDYITSELNIRKEWLQEVMPSGAPIGHLRSEWAKPLGLHENVIVTAGITDGCASQVASGAVNVGDWNTTIGTTLVVKGVSRNEIKDPAGAIYCHRHPEGYWMPGGASNTGADWVSTMFADSDLTELANAARTIIPGKNFAWPLLQHGERFPFVAPSAKGFFPEGINKDEKFVACMEGVAYIERYAFERIRKISGENISQIFSAGGGSNSDIWMKIRSAVLNLPVCKMQNVSGAAGAAITAASKTYFEDIIEAGTNMIHAEKIIDPDFSLLAPYEERYRQFIQLLKDKDYINE